MALAREFRWLELHPDMSRLWVPSRSGHTQEATPHCSALPSAASHRPKIQPERPRPCRPVSNTPWHYCQGGSSALSMVQDSSWVLIIFWWGWKGNSWLFVEKATTGHTNSNCYRKRTLRTTLGISRESSLFNMMKKELVPKKSLTVLTITEFFIWCQAPCQHFTCLISFNPHNHRTGTANVTHTSHGALPMSPTFNTRNCPCHSHFRQATATVTHTSHKGLSPMPTLDR